jgi:hypothetical protein
MAGDAVRYIAGLVVGGSRLLWQHMAQFGSSEPPGITITIGTSDRSPLKASRELAAVLSNNNVDWLELTPQGLWLFKTKAFTTQFPEYATEAWLQSDVLIPMDHDYTVRTINQDGWEHEEAEPHCQFVITPEIIEDQMPRKVFLSHKGGADKPMVRRHKKALEVIGIDAWLDEDAMHAGVELERGILRGFKESCAAVFFITPRYRDEGYLATEINYAIAEKRAKGDRFRIVTLVLPDPDGSVGTVPDLLQPYIYKTPATELQGFTEVVQALPLAICQATWKT